MDAVVHYDAISGLVADPGLYLQFDDADNTVIEFQEGTGRKKYRYYITLADLLELELPAGRYYPTVRLGDPDAPSAEDEIKAVLDFSWKGTAEGGLNSSGGFLIGQIGHASLAPDDTLEIIQGEEKTILFVVYPRSGQFTQDVFDAITVKFADPDGTIITKTEEDGITRVTQELDLQAIRCTLYEEETRTLVSGNAQIEVAFDNQKARMSHALRIVEEIGSDDS